MMSNPHTNAAAKKRAEELCDIVNERFGYRAALEYILHKRGFEGGEFTKIIDLARRRELQEFEIAYASKGLK